MKPGDKAKISKRTFLYNGIFVHTGSIVTVKEVFDNGTILVEYLDKEGHPHAITFQNAELDPI